MKENGKIFAVIAVIVILLIVSFNFIKKSNYNVREEAKATAENENIVRSLLKLIYFT